MKTLVIGCGSIGRRHARNARALGSEVVLCDLDERRMREFAREIGVEEYFTDYARAVSQSGADTAVVATPSNYHIAPARKALQAGLHVLIEKPLCLSLSEGKDLRTLVRETGLVCMMAHTYRFRPEWIEVKRLVDAAGLGATYSAEFMGGWYLPDWHVREDYRREYAAQNHMGGGVVLTNLSHIFDIIIWFFGDIERVVGAKMRLGKLAIDVDDTAVCTVYTASGVAVTLVEDFLSRCPRRQLRLNTEHGYIEADFNRQTLSNWDARKKRFHPDDTVANSPDGARFRILEDGVAYDPNPDTVPMAYSGNDAYLGELRHFFGQVAARNTVFDLDIDAGIKALETILHIGIEDWTLEAGGKQ